MYSFGGNEGGFKVLQGASVGQVYDVTTQKNDSGFIEWPLAILSDQVVAATGSASPPDKQGLSAPSGSGSTATPYKSTYETPEERAKKQIYIVRQSTIAQAINLLSVGAKGAPKIDDVLSVAKVFEDYVFGETVKPMDVATAFDDLDDMPQ